MNWKSKAIQNFLNDCIALSRQEPEGERFLKIEKKKKKERNVAVNNWDFNKLF